MRITDRRAIAQAHLQTPRLFLMAIGALISNDEFPSHRALKVGETASRHKTAPTAADHMIPIPGLEGCRFVSLEYGPTSTVQVRNRLGDGGDLTCAAGARLAVRSLRPGQPLL